MASDPRRPAPPAAAGARPRDPGDRMKVKRAGAPAGFALAGLLAASAAPAQLVSRDEARARRGCIDEAGRRGWLVEEVREEGVER